MYSDIQSKSEAAHSVAH